MVDPRGQYHRCISPSGILSDNCILLFGVDVNPNRIVHWSISLLYLVIVVIKLLRRRAVVSIKNKVVQASAESSRLPINYLLFVIS